MKRFFPICLAACAAFAQGSGGIAPRLQSADYPVRKTSGDLTVAAAMLTPAEAKKVFTADLDRAGFLVFEVAAYPEKGAQIDLGPDQFTLRIVNDPAILSSSTPEAIIAVMYKGKPSTPQMPDKVHVYTTANVGYESGGAGRRGGVYAGGGTAVGVGDAPYPTAPPSTAPAPVDRDTLQVQLAAREFPNTKATEAVAGYLYFSKPQTKPKNGVYQLTFHGSGLNSQPIALDVPAVPAKAAK
jgi:hypothetical protein